MSERDPAAAEPQRLGASNGQAAEVAVGETELIQIVEETVRIDKRMVEIGRVRVRTHTETTEQVLHECLRSDVIGVTRVPINRTLSDGEAPPITRTEAGVTIIPVLEEILVVEKRLVLKEEVHIRETRSGEEVEIPVTLRKQHAVVERVTPDGHVTEVKPKDTPL